MQNLHQRSPLLLLEVKIRAYMHFHFWKTKMVNLPFTCNTKMCLVNSTRNFGFPSISIVFTFFQYFYRILPLCSAFTYHEIIITTIKRRTEKNARLECKIFLIIISNLAAEYITGVPPHLSHPCLF